MYYYYFSKPEGSMVDAFEMSIKEILQLVKKRGIIHQIDALTEQDTVGKNF